MVIVIHEFRSVSRYAGSGWSQKSHCTTPISRAIIGVYYPYIAVTTHFCPRSTTTAAIRLVHLQLPAACLSADGERLKSVQLLTQINGLLAACQLHVHSAEAI